MIVESREVQKSDELFIDNIKKRTYMIGLVKMLLMDNLEV